MTTANTGAAPAAPAAPTASELLADIEHDAGTARALLALAPVDMALVEALISDVIHRGQDASSALTRELPQEEQ